MIILGIETSCDETAAAVYGENGLLSNVIASQTIHQQFGGIVPELASREHMKLIVPIVKKALKHAAISSFNLNGIAVTYGPGLIGSILVGLNFAKAMAYSLKIPWIGINHIEGHILANFVTGSELKPPFIALIISGGHTQLVYVKQLGEYITMGKTKDDAAGEAFDKVAKMMELGYPGGPIIDRLAKYANEKFVKFPRAMIKEHNFDFSFSGLKTAVLYYLKRITKEERDKFKADIAASFQAALVEVLVEKTFKAVKQKKVKTVTLAGGVASNSYLRQQMKLRARQEGINLFIPSPILCTDNAAMIALTGLYKLKNGENSLNSLSPKPYLKL